jgi:hypothetical protein
MRDGFSFASILAFIEISRGELWLSSVYTGTKIYSLWYLTYERFIAVAVLILLKFYNCQVLDI